MTKAKQRYKNPDNTEEVYIQMRFPDYSSNINEFIREISALFIFFTKRFHTKKSIKSTKNAHKRTKTKKAAFLCA